MEPLKEALLKELNLDNMRETILFFCHLFRYSGTDEGEAAVSYLENKLQSYGVSYEKCQYHGFFSLPVDAQVTVSGKTFSLIADVYSAPAEALSGQLFYDAWSEQSTRTPLEEDARFASFHDKLILTWDGRGTFARRAMDAGAKGILHICATKGNYIHHSNIGVAWGTPGLDEAPYMQFLPSAGIKRADGEELIALLKKEPSLSGSLTIHMDTQIRPTSMVIAEIPGETEDFLLVSGHYDSWYEGITDNAGSDAILLEYARILQTHQKELKRSVKIAWWSGHSDGRFSGSAWYCDSHWEALHAHCSAHINLDLTGCKNSEQIVARTAGTEGLAYTGALIEKYTGTNPASYIPMIRGADQSFWGVHVPITIMLKYEPTKEKRISDCPSGGPWWHTSQDTLDKLDEAILMRDAKINMELIHDIGNASVLPVDVPGFLTDMDARLRAILAGLPDDFDTAPVLSAWKPMRQSFQALWEQTGHFLCDADMKATVGKLLHLIYCRKDSYTHDFGDGFGIFGAFRRFSGLTDKNSSPAYYTMANAEFLRNRNRLCDGLSEISRELRRISEEHI